MPARVRQSGSKGKKNWSMTAFSAMESLMPNLANGKLPSYRLHKPSHRAIVTLSGVDIYLGGVQLPREP